MATDYRKELKTLMGFIECVVPTGDVSEFVAKSDGIVQGIQDRVDSDPQFAKIVATVLGRKR